MYSNVVRIAVVLASFSCLLTQAARAENEMTLSVLRFAEGRTVKFPMFPTRRVAQAQMKSQVKFESGQSWIEVEYKGLKPAVLFDGDVTCYVLWAINRDGAYQNLGELRVIPKEPNNKLEFSTGLRNFALLVTAEAFYQTARPSELVMFWNDGKADPPVPSDSINFSDLAKAPEYKNETLGGLSYTKKKPLDLIQAERLFSQAQRVGAANYAGALLSDAQVSLQQATHMYERDRREGSERFSRRSIAASNEAIQFTLRRIEFEELEKQIAKRQAEMQALEGRARDSESKAADAEKRAAEASARTEEAQRTIELVSRQRAEAEASVEAASRDLERIRKERDQLDDTLASLRQEQQRLNASMADLRVEKDALQGRLQEALSQVADTRESARGFIVNLPDILFDVGQATLKPDAKLALAKLAGILLIMRDLNLRVEGHTDSTGSPSFNMRLSQRRADSVYDFMALQGIQGSRMKTQGYGIERPIADNTTAEGRKKNRRVEIIIAEGEVAAEG